MTNPLLETSTLPNLAPRFDLIKTEHFEPAITEGIIRARANIAAIKNNKDTPSFENTIEALETSSDDLDTAHTIYHNLLSAVGGDELQALSEKLDPAVAAYSSEVALDADLFARVKAVYDAADKNKMSDEQWTLLDNTYKGFVRNGALLPEDKKERLKAIDQEMSVLAPKYRENNTKARGAFAYFTADKNELAGIPDIILAAMEESATKKGKTGEYCVTLDYAVYIPVVTYAHNRALREKIWRANAALCAGDAWDTTKLAEQILALSNERAQLLGYKTPAHYVLERRMAETPETVFKFLDDLKKRYKPAGLQDIAMVKKFAHEKDGLDDIQPWDTAYYSEKLKEEKFSFNDEELRPYFPIEKVLAGTFAHFSRLFSIRFVENKNYPLYHPDVKAYDVFDDETNVFRGTFYADLFPRPGEKKEGAWATSFRDGGIYKGEKRAPVVAIVCNFTKPVAGKPALVTHNEVETLFHEMGHALHGLLGSSPYRSISGYHVLWDFVELPSQVQENWTYEPQTLALISSHYETGESLPADLIEKMRAAKNFMAGSFGLRQIGLATLDMHFYSEVDKALSTGLAKFEDALMDEFRLLPNAKVTPRIFTNFSHIFAGGYSAGYYSYKWAEVLDADAFEAFRETDDLYNSAVAKKFKTLLSSGGARPPAVLYREFRGRDADVAALARREGLTGDKANAA
ncbi:MAG: M3 family peptidase [Alphaproteobacteria bacterium]|nr:M3 family peptidase [Alphaproteobacteria bacterium]